IGLKKQELVSEGKLIKQKLLELKHERDDSKQAIPQLKAKIIQLKTERKAVIQENRSNMAVLGTASALLLIGLIPTPASPVLLGAGALLLTAYSAVRLSMALIKGGNHLGKWLGSKLGLAAQKESSSQHANHSTVQTQSSLSTNLSAHSQIDLETPHDSIKNQASSENLTHHEETLLHDAPPSPTPMYPESTGVKDEALTHTDLLFTTDFIEHNIHPETTASLAETPQKKSRIDEDEGEGEGKSESTGFRLDL
ncbi:MAG: hypothetical protein EBX40_06705, partial [Gammaproteobacteria bacterium]|nr:hypothetical protein [Gammaproteobacteria bacterium]